MSIVFFGTPDFSVPSLKALIKAGEDVRAVVTQPDKRSGKRGKEILPPPVKEYALNKSIEALQPQSMKEESFINLLKSIAPEFIVVVAFGRILPKAVLDVPLRMPINVHASLLPKYRGASPIAWALINGEDEAGITTMKMSEGLDEGDVLLQEAVKIKDDDTTESLGIRLSETGASLLMKTIKGLRAGTIEPKPQTGEPSFAPPFKKEDGRVDWSIPARRIYNFQRAMHPWPGAFCHIFGERVKLINIKPVSGEGPPGIIMDLSSDSLMVGTGDGLIAIEELQPEGKKPMKARAFVAGRKIKKGDSIN